MIHKLLQQQLRAYCVVLVEQADNGQFNRAKLMNVGFLEMQKHQFFKHLPDRYGEKAKDLLPYVNMIDKSNPELGAQKMLLDRPNCYSFHDVDLLPENDHNLYICKELQAIHQCDKYSKFDYKTQFASGGHVTAGGTVLISHDHYKYVNGHPNIFFGWGVEDIEMADRLRPEINATEIYDIGSHKYIIPKNEKLLSLVNDGLTEHGGGPGFTRMDKYGYYFQIGHQHGFTSGPNMLKSNAQRAGRNDSGEKYDENGRKMKRELSDLSQYDIIPSPLDAAILRNNFKKFKEARAHYSSDGTFHKGYLDENTVKYYPNGTPLTSHHFDGLMDTKYSRFSGGSQFSNGHEATPLFSKYTVDIRPAAVDRVVIRYNGKSLMDFQPDQHLDDKCSFVKYPNATIDFYDDIESLSSSRHAEKSLEQKLMIAEEKCEAREKDELGECNAFSIARPTTMFDMPHPLHTFYPTEDFLVRTGQSWPTYTVFVKHCPGKMGQFQAVEEPIKINYDMFDENKKTTLDFFYDLKVQQVPAGGLVYLDHVHYEGQHHSTRILELANSRDLNMPLNYRETEFADKTQRMKIIMSGDGNILKIHVVLTLINTPPGFYAFHIKISDYFGQPYLDQHVVMRLVEKHQDRDIKFHQHRVANYDKIQEQLYNNATYINEKYLHQDPGWPIITDIKALDEVRIKFLEKLAISYGYDVESAASKEKLCGMNLYSHTNQTIAPWCHAKKKLCSIMPVKEREKYMKTKYGQTLEEACELDVEVELQGLKKLI